MRRAVCVLAVLLVASPAAAQTVERPRVFGAGFGFGLGTQSWNAYDWGVGYRPASLGASLATLELMAFDGDHFSVDVTLQPWIPVLDAAVTAAFAWTTTIYFDWSFGEQTRFVIGPGLGVSGHTSPPHDPRLEGSDGAQLRLAGLIGLEVLTAERLFGFRLVTRPWLSLGGGVAGFQAGGGAMLEALFMFYAI